MAEYIDKQDAIDIFKQFKKRKWISMPIEQVIEIISVVPYVEVEPIKHGRWIRTHFASPVWECSVCGANYNRASMIGANWCEACGAKMDLDEVEE